MILLRTHLLSHVLDEEYKLEALERIYINMQQNVDLLCLVSVVFLSESFLISLRPWLSRPRLGATRDGWSKRPRACDVSL